MKIKFIEQVETEKDIHLPYYFINRFGNHCKAYENHVVGIHVDSHGSKITLDDNLHFQELFHEMNLGRFIERQQELKAQFEKSLSEIIDKITK